MGAHLKKALGLRISDAAHARLDRLALAYGGKQRVIEAALEALEGRGEPSDAELVEMLAARLASRQVEPPAPSPDPPNTDGPKPRAARQRPSKA